MSDLELPALWRDPIPRMDYHLARLREYEAANGVQFGGSTLILALAVGAAETALDSFRVGQNAKNGTPSDHPAHHSCAYGVWQIDSWYLRENVVAGHWPQENAWPESFIGRPSVEWDYLLGVPGYVKRTSPTNIEINWNLWSTYKRNDHAQYIDDATLALKREP